MKKLLLFIVLATLIGCSCWPQIPPKYLPANSSCEAYLPNYIDSVSVINPCGEATLMQDPVPGTILSATTPSVEVTLTAINSFGNTDEEKFSVFLTVMPEIIWDSIPNGPIPPVTERRNDIDLLIESWETYRAHLGDTIVYDTIWPTLTLHHFRSK